MVEHMSYMLSFCKTAVQEPPPPLLRTPLLGVPQSPHAMHSAPRPAAFRSYLLLLARALARLSSIRNPCPYRIVFVPCLRDVLRPLMASMPKPSSLEAAQGASRHPIGAEPGSLFLGTEVFALRDGALAGLGVTHRLSCLMSPVEERQWMAYAAAATRDAPDLATFVTEADTGPVQVARCPMADEDAFRPFALARLQRGAAFIDAALSSGGRVYVHCTHGVSRSPAVVIYFLMAHRGMSLLEACERVKARRVKISPTGGFVAVLAEAEEAQRGSGGRSDPQAVRAVLQRRWIEDFRAGRVKLSQADCIL